MRLRSTLRRSRKRGKKKQKRKSRRSEMWNFKFRCVWEFVFTLCAAAHPLFRFVLFRSAWIVIITVDCSISVLCQDLRHLQSLFEVCVIVNFGLSSWMKKKK